MRQLKHFIKKDRWKKDSVPDAIGLYGLPPEVESSNEWKLFGMPRQYNPSIESGDLRTNVKTIAYDDKAGPDNISPNRRKK